MFDKIIVFGDSIAYGKWDREGGWVVRLRKYIDKKEILYEDLDLDEVKEARKFDSWWQPKKEIKVK